MIDNRKSENLEPEEKLAQFKSDIAKDASAVNEQREQANQDMRFINVPGGMWEGFLPNDFGEDRIKLEFDLISDFVQRFLGEWDSNRVGVEFKATDDKSTEEDADLMNGLYRADYRDSAGDVAVDQAVEEAATCGFGALMLATYFEDDEDEENDNQRIEWRPIANAYNSVFWDQAAQRIDKRDARWCTVLKPYTRDGFEERFPEADAVSAYSPTIDQINTTYLSTPELIYVATRYEAVRKKEKIYIYNNIETGVVEFYNQEDHDLVKDELAKDDMRFFVRERTIMRRSVEKTVFSGEKILEKTRRIVGKYIPIIPFYGYRTYVDGVEWYRGLVRKQKDAGRLFNMQVSQLGENSASAGQEVPIFAPEQMKNQAVANLWADKNNKPYLLAEPLRDKNGNIVQHGPIGYSKPPQLDGSTSKLLEIVPAFIREVTGGAPQDTLDPDASGKAINAMLKRGNLSTRVIVRNIASAIEWAGEVYQAMASEVYTTPRKLTLVGKDGTDKRVAMHKTILDHQTGLLVEANVINDKKFKAYADTGPEYETMREQTVDDLKGMLESLSGVPEGQAYTSALIAVLLENISGVGMDPIKKLNRRIMLTQGLVKPETEEEMAMVEQANQPQDDPQQALIEATANQQNAEARSLEASSIQKMADAKYKEAKTMETVADIQNNEKKLQLEAQRQIDERQRKVIEQLRGLPIG